MGEHMYNDQISAAPAVFGDGDVQAPAAGDGHADEETQDVDGSVAEAPYIDVGHAEPEDEESPLEHDGKRNLKAEAASMEHMLTHTSFNVHCPSCLRAKMLRKPTRVEHDPTAAPKRFGD